MFTVFQEEKWSTIFLFTSLLLSVILRIMIGVLYQHMIKETENMSATSNKFLKHCKMKFVNCYQLNNGVANVPVFVDKLMARLHVGPFSYQTIYRLSGQLVLLSVFFAGLGSCRCLIKGSSLGEVLPFYIVSFLGLYIYFAVSDIVDAKGRKRNLKTNLVDYLENHMVNRLRAGAFEEEKPQRKNRESRTGIEVMPVYANTKAETFDGHKAEAGKTEGIAVADREEEKMAGQAAGLLNRIQEKELEELLKEFLTS